jgi:ketosteroid isomerase-like protein
VPDSAQHTQAGNKREVEQFIACLSRADYDALFELVHPDVTWRIPGRAAEAGVFHGAAEVREKVFARLSRLLDGPLVLHIDALIAEGDWVVARAHGEGRRRDGAPYRNRYSLVYRLRDGRIVELEEYFDTSRAAVELFGKRLVEGQG